MPAGHALRLSKNDDEMEKDGLAVLMLKTSNPSQGARGSLQSKPSLSLFRRRRCADDGDGASGKTTLDLPASWASNAGELPTHVPRLSAAHRTSQQRLDARCTRCRHRSQRGTSIKPANPDSNTKSNRSLTGTPRPAPRLRRATNRSALNAAIPDAARLRPFTTNKP